MACRQVGAGGGQISEPWRHQMETFSASLALCVGNSPVTQSFDVFFDLRLNKRLRKQSWGWWFEKPRVQYDVTVMCRDEFVDGKSFFS